MDMAKPIIRFKGYLDDWEQRKAKELCNIGTGKSNTQDQVEDGIYPFYIRSDIPVKSNKYLYDCEAVITIGDGNIGRVFHYVNGKFDLHQRCYKMTDFQDIWGKYFYYFFSTRFYERAMKMTAKATVDSVRLEMISEMDIWKPTAIDEQKKIAEFFSNLDHLITLHQRKCDETKKLKKYMLQKMFPQNGEKVPEIRFLGFTDDWEQRKLGEHCEMYNGDRSSKYPNAQDMVAEGIPFINAGDLENGRVNLTECNKISREKYDDLGGAKLQLGDIVYCLRGTLGKNAYIDNFTEGTVASSLVAIRPKNIDGRFMFHVLNSDIEYRQRMVHDEGAAQPNLSAKSVSEFIMPVPHIDEQKEISAYFDNLDHLITLHQRELENLQNIKRFMLGKMFV